MSQIVIDVAKRQLYLYESSTMLNSFPIAVGKSSTPTPPGTYTIIEKIPYPGGVFGTRWLGPSRRIMASMEPTPLVNRPQSPTAVSACTTRMWNTYMIVRYRYQSADLK